MYCNISVILAALTSCSWAWFARECEEMTFNLGCTLLSAGKSTVSRSNACSSGMFVDIRAASRLDASMVINISWRGLEKNVE